MQENKKNTGIKPSSILAMIWLIGTIIMVRTNWVDPKVVLDESISEMALNNFIASGIVMSGIMLVFIFILGIIKMGTQPVEKQNPFEK